MSLQDALAVFDHARLFALGTGKKPTIIIKQTEHMGDTLYATPVIRHYRMKYPHAAIAFVTGHKYADVHRYNPHIDRLFVVPVNSDWRLAYKQKMDAFADIDIKLAPAVAFGKWYASHQWSHPNLFDQYLCNAGITDLNPLGGRQPVAVCSNEEESWVTNFLAVNKIDPNRAIALEYNSYSHGLGWTPAEFQQFCHICVNKVYVIALAGSNEGLYVNTVDARGTSWLRSAALLNRIRGIVGVSSGMSVLASTCPRKPFIFEINVPDSISIKTMGFSSNCLSVVGGCPEHMVNLVCDKVFRS
jgi:hypothetical protein